MNQALDSGFWILVSGFWFLVPSGGSVFLLNLDDEKRKKDYLHRYIYPSKKRGKRLI
jgi:hypothetical protein